MTDGHREPEWPEIGAARRVVVRGGQIIDGTGSPPFRGDVLIDAGRVVTVGDVGSAGDALEVDATGLYVTPGFIDIHSHADYTLLEDPRAESALAQGVTTLMIGNCGFGCFPTSGTESASKSVYGYTGRFGLSWPSAAAYFETLSAAGPAVNVGSLVPHAQLRNTSMPNVGAAASAADLATMGRLLAEGLDDGAFGLSTGLEYPAEHTVADADLMRLWRELTRHHRLYATHTRFRSKGSADELASITANALKAGVRLQISHLAPRNGAAELERALAVVDAARARGLDVGFDMHTRRFGFTYLYVALPPNVLELPPRELSELLAARAGEDAMASHHGMFNLETDQVVVMANPVRPEWAGKSIRELADEQGRSPLRLACDLLAEAVPDLHVVPVALPTYSESLQETIFTHDLCLPASDATSLCSTGSLGGEQFHGAYTWAAWFLSHFVVDRKLLKVGDAVRRLTSAPARTLGLHDRGVLAPGQAADVAVFDLEQLRPVGLGAVERPAVGMRHVLVNGVFAVHDGLLTQVRPGQVLRAS